MAMKPAKAITFSRSSSHAGIGAPLSDINPTGWQFVPHPSTGGRAGTLGYRTYAPLMPTMKTPPAPEDTDGVFHAFTSGKVAALGRRTSAWWFRSRRVEI